MPNSVLPVLKPGQKIAGLDIHSPLCLKTKESPNKMGDISTLYPLIDQAAKAGFTLIQFTPIHDTGLINNPYIPISFFSLNPIHININNIPYTSKQALLSYQRRFQPRYVDDLVFNYQPAYQFKINLLRQSYIYFSQNPNPDFEKFKKNLNPHIQTYGIFKALSLKFKTPWYNWPDEFKTADISQISKNNPQLSKDVDFHLYLQWILTSQWQEVISYARSKNITFLLDKPYLPFPDSADVWSHQSLFYLNPDGTPQYVSGVNNPGDPFGQQHWGHAVLQFEEKPQKTSQFLIQHIKFLAQFSSAIRLDHALGLAWKYYLINPITHQGFHKEALKQHLFNIFHSTFNHFLLIAEDLGYSSEEIDQFFKKYNIPTMRCPQWLDSPRHSSVQKYPEQTLVFTSNHDTDSLPAWWNTLSKEKQLTFIKTTRQHVISDSDKILVFIQTIFSSPSQIAMVSLRDIEGDTRRFNTPGTPDSQNWNLRTLKPIEEIDFSNIKKIITDSGRNLT